MGTYIEKGCLTYKDKNGDLHELYPATYKECVYGMEELDAHLVDYENPHKLKPATIGAAESDHTHDEFEEIGNTIKSMSDSVESSFDRIDEELNRIDSEIDEVQEVCRSISKGSATNLLDNSYFVNPINSQGETSYGATSLTIDRWYTGAGSIAVTVMDDCVRFANPNGYGFMYQYLPKENFIVGQKYTIAIKLKDHDVYVGTIMNNGLVFGDEVDSMTINFDFGYLKLGAEGDYGDTEVIENYRFFIGVNSTQVDIEWVALYKGEFSADMLPDYLVKDRLMDVANCRRYYMTISGGDSFVVATAVGVSDTSAIAVMHLPIEMYVNDALSSTLGVKLTSGTATLISESGDSVITALNVTSLDKNIINISVESTGLAVGKIYLLKLTDAVLEFSSNWS